MAAQTRNTNKASVTRRQLLDAALTVIAEHGYGDATVDRIVDAAGVSKGVAYYHFESKDDLVTCLLAEGLQEIIAEFQAAAQGASTARNALTAMAECFGALMFRRPAFGRFLVSELWRDDRAWSPVVEPLEEQLVALLAEQIVRGQQEGAIRPEIDPAFEAVAIVGMVLTTTLLYLRDAPGDLDGTEAASADADFIARQQQFVAQLCDFVHHANQRA